MVNTFSFPTNISFGPGVLSQLPAYLKEHSFKKPMVVTDEVVKELPFFKKILDLLKKAGLDPQVFSDIHKNPLKSDVLKGKHAYGHERDCLVGLGGGSALDVSRAIALSINHDRDLFDYDELTGGSSLITEPIPHFITVPTTSGTGSEVGRAAIISEDESKRKRILFHPSLMAKQVFADPELTYDLPPDITAATGMDALTHHMEAFLAKGYNPMCDGIALEGIQLIWNSLERAVHRPDEHSRHQMMMASLMGAVAFQKGLGIVHSLSHPLSTLLDLHHGLANAVNLPYGLEFNYAVCKHRFDKMAVQMNIRGGREVPKAVKELNQRLGLPLNLKQCGVEPIHIDDLSKLAAKDFCLPSNPREASTDDIKSIYQEALG
jgi:alcohol dehydrogenase class IV